MSAIKGLAALGGVGGLAAASFVAVQQMSNSGFTPKTIDSESGDTYNEKYVNDFKHHFVSAQEENKAWWEDVYRAFEIFKKDHSSSLSTQFQAVTSAYDATTNTALNQVCKTAYTKTSTELFPTSGNTADAYRKDTWIYCSLSREYPILTEKEDAYKSENTKIGGKNKTKLVSTNGNDKWWGVQEKAFFKHKIGDVEKEGLGNSGTTNTTFKTFYGTGHKTSKSTLREICKAAYEKVETGNENEKTDALKFCSINK